MAGVIAEGMYSYLEKVTNYCRTNKKDCTGSRGMKDQDVIDEALLTVLRG